MHQLDRSTGIPSDTQRLHLLMAVVEMLGATSVQADGCGGILRVLCDATGASAGGVYLASKGDDDPLLTYRWPDGHNVVVDINLVHQSIVTACLQWRYETCAEKTTIVVPWRGRKAIDGAVILVWTGGAAIPANHSWEQTLQSVALQVGLFIDVTEPQSTSADIISEEIEVRLQDAYDQLRVAKLRYQALVEQIPILTYTASLDEGHKLLFISPQVQDWLGYTPEECMAAPDWWSQVIHPDDQPSAIRSTWRTNPDIRETNTEYRVLTRAGQILWVRDDARTALDEHGNRLFVQGAITDITERKQSHEELAIALAREHELNELKTRFITTVSHEFRTPLSRILSAAELIERYGDRITPDKRRNYVDQIRTSITFMADMLQEVLLVGNYEIGITRADARPIDLEQFCAELAQQMQMKLGTRCRLIYDAHGDCLSARMDPILLKQILTNLLNNAIRYSTQPDPTVEFTLECDSARAIFRIVDHGIGIPIEDQPHIFDAFHRGGNVSLIAGSGLGLAIVRNALQASRGEISFQSALGHGTTFTVSVPLR